MTPSSAPPHSFDSSTATNLEWMAREIQRLRAENSQCQQSISGYISQIAALQQSVASVKSVKMKTQEAQNQELRKEVQRLRATGLENQRLKDNLMYAKQDLDEEIAMNRLNRNEIKGLKVVVWSQQNQITDLKSRLLKAGYPVSETISDDLPYHLPLTPESDRHGSISPTPEELSGPCSVGVSMKDVETAKPATAVNIYTPAGGEDHRVSGGKVRPIPPRARPMQKRNGKLALPTPESLDLNTNPEPSHNFSGGEVVTLHRHGKVAYVVKDHGKHVMSNSTRIINDDQKNVTFAGSTSIKRKARDGDVLESSTKPTKKKRKVSDDLLSLSSTTPNPAPGPSPSTSTGGSANTGSENTSSSSSGTKSSGIPVRSRNAVSRRAASGRCFPSACPRDSDSAANMDLGD
ncbi:hypothetical protein HDU97_004485 [Phlyctochytrium planicorne]|nr:hypothetical protein HDU97_004485 [Phlyctochytrium planicorne]